MRRVGSRSVVWTSPYCLVASDMARPGRAADSLLSTAGLSAPTLSAPGPRIAKKPSCAALDCESATEATTTVAPGYFCTSAHSSPNRASSART